MYLFEFPPQSIYAVMGTPRRGEVTIEPATTDSDIGRALQAICDHLGSGSPRFEMHFFPPTFDGPTTLESRPNRHLFQILGHSLVDGQMIRAGHVASVDMDIVMAHSEPFAPCVFAVISFDTPHTQTHVEAPVRAALHDAAYAKHDVDQDKKKFIMVKDNVVSPSTCQQIIASLETGSERYGSVLTDAENNTTVVQADIRRVNMMNTNRKALVRETLERIIVQEVEGFYETTMEFWNAPVLLRYEAGDFFIPHVDSEQFLRDRWVRIYDRDYTLVCFLNDDYDGGELAFPDYDYDVKPKAGRVVCFPGDHTYRHGARETTRGTRFQLVSWLTAYGTPRTRTPPNPDVIYRRW